MRRLDMSDSERSFRAAGCVHSDDEDERDEGTELEREGETHSQGESDDDAED